MSATPIKERPILFSGPMIRAILEGRKTQTRRIIKLPSWSTNDWSDFETDGKEAEIICANTGCLASIPCPYGQVGDRLYCRETWSKSLPEWQIEAPYIYRADHLDPKGDAQPIKWKPAIHMPKEASRITLEITDVRVQRLQEISEEDAIAEGIRLIGDTFPHGGDFWKKGPNFYTIEYPGWSFNAPTAKECFAHLWDSINGKTYPWGSNLFVRAVSFKRIAQQTEVTA
ncbi:MAG TPA: hypothetical protein V6C63_14215 [Allocoleopsis sp.]